MSLQNTPSTDSTQLKKQKNWLRIESYKVIDWASNVANNEEPDVVFAAAGTEPNLEALAAVSILHKAFPELKIRFVNVVDILKLRHPSVDIAWTFRRRIRPSLHNR